VSPKVSFRLARQVLPAYVCSAIVAARAGTWAACPGGAAMSAPAIAIAGGGLVCRPRYVLYL
jgi:hypothetical protein